MCHGLETAWSNRAERYDLGLLHNILLLLMCCTTLLCPELSSNLGSGIRAKICLCSTLTPLRAAFFSQSVFQPNCHPSIHCGYPDLGNAAVQPIPVRIDRLTSCILLFQGLIHTIENGARVSLSDFWGRHSTDVESNSRDLAWGYRLQMRQ